MRRTAGGSTTPDDADLVERMAGGDRDAFAVLYDRHAPMLMSLAKKILGTADGPTDLLHDVLLEAWEHAAEYDRTRATVRTWLALRLRSRALDRLGSARVRRSVPFEESAATSGLSADASSTPDAIGVRRALNTVSADARHVLELTYFLGLTATEIASRLDVPIGTVKSRRARGLALLEAALTDGGRDVD